MRRGLGVASVVDPVEGEVARGRRVGEVAGVVGAGAGVARLDSTTAGVRDAGVLGVPMEVPAPGLTWAHAFTLSTMASTTIFFMGERSINFSEYPTQRTKNKDVPAERTGKP